MDKKEWIDHCKWLDTFRGKIVEKNSVDNIFNHPAEEYTKELISSVPSPLPV